MWGRKTRTRKSCLPQKNVLINSVWWSAHGMRSGLSDSKVSFILCQIYIRAWCWKLQLVLFISTHYSSDVGPQYCPDYCRKEMTCLKILFHYILLWSGQTQGPEAWLNLHESTSTKRTDVQEQELKIASNAEFLLKKVPFDQAWNFIILGARQLGLQRSNFFVCTKATCPLIKQINF